MCDPRLIGARIARFTPHKSMEISCTARLPSTRTRRGSVGPREERRSPGQSRVVGAQRLHHHAPVTLSKSPHNPAASTAITGLYVEHQTTLTPSDRNQMETLQTDKQITPITTTKRHRAAASRVRHHPRSLKTAGVEVRSSSRTSTSTRNPRPTPGHPHSTLKSRLNVI